MYVVMCVRQHAFNIVHTHTHTHKHTHTHSLSLSLSLCLSLSLSLSHTHQGDVPDGLRKNLNDATNKFTPNTLEAKRRDPPVQTRFPEPEKSKDGIWTNLSTSKMRESSQLFRDTFETYCRTAKNLNGKTAHYLAPDAKYPKADRLEKDIQGDKLV
jgi:hypothetical protein